jgi:hypothetical protein
MPSRNAHRGLNIHDIPRLRKRDNRATELFVDCYGDAEAAGAIHTYLADALDYPFKAVWRDSDGLRVLITVMALEDNWNNDTGLMFSVESDAGDDLASVHQVYGRKSGQVATVLDDYRAWWPYDLIDAEEYNE